MQANNMNPEYITRALCFHGKPMQKIWEDERGAGDLQGLGIPTEPNYAIYQERQRHFTFQDRAKRLKLHQFIARKSSDLYDVDLKPAPTRHPADTLTAAKDVVAVMPPYEIFVNKKQDKQTRWRCALEGIKPGDVIYGVVTKPNNSLTTAPMLIKPLCTAEPLVRYLNDIPIKAYVYMNNLGTPPMDKRSKPRGYAVNDFICCEVLEVSVDADRLSLGLEGVMLKNPSVQLGLVELEDLPLYYRKTLNIKFDQYEDCLRSSKEMLNPDIDMLYEINGLDPRDSFTLMTSLKGPFPTQDYAKELRQTQASKWAFRSVAEGVERFKIGHHVEAFQCLNKALNIDPHNVEGLVARGALYANKGSFVKAVADFEKALKLNSYHVNARKYMGETLVALGRSYEDEQRIHEAAKAYRDCLNIISNHEQARISLEAIQQRTGTYFFDNFSAQDGQELESEAGLGAAGGGGGGVGVGGAATGAIDRAATENMPSVRRSKNSSSSASSSSAGDNSTNSSESVDSESDQSANSQKKEPSLSPLSKRMALHDASLRAAGNPSSSQQSFNQPYYATIGDAGNPIDFKVTQLDDDDTETRVRKLLIDASKHKKEKCKKTKSKEKDGKKGWKLAKNEDSRTADGLSAEDDYYNTHSSNGTARAQAQAQALGDVQPYGMSQTGNGKAHRAELHQQSFGALEQPERSPTPPPKAPSMKIDEPHYHHVLDDHPLPSTSIAVSGAVRAVSGAPVAAAVQQPSRLSFPLKKPVKIDKFGLVRIATPLGLKSPTPTRSYSPSRSRSRSARSRSARRPRAKSPLAVRRHSRRRSSSSERSRRRRRRRSHSRSRSRSRSSRKRYQSSRGFHGRRRTPSPFVPRDTSPARRRRSRSHDYASRRRASSRSPRGRDRASDSSRPQFRNRVWQRPGYATSTTGGRDSSERTKSSGSSDRRTRDKYEDPSIEEIDELINKAQRERKEEIIKRDRDILKKPAGGAGF